MRKLTYFLVVFSVLLLFISLTVLFLSDRIVQSETFYANVNISDRIGFDVNGSALTFGNVVSGGSSTRKIIIDNNYSFPIAVYVTAEGDIAPLLNFDKIVLIKEGESKLIPISVVSSGFDYGAYTGNVSFKLLRSVR